MPDEPSNELVLRDAAIALRDSTLQRLRSVLLEVDDRRAELVAEDDIDNLAAGAQDLGTLLHDLNAIQRQVRVDLAEMMDRRAGRDYGITRWEVEGVGVLECKGGWTRKNWRSEELLRDIIATAIRDGAGADEGERIVNRDGEVLDVADSQTLNDIMQVLITCLPITSSLSWRTGQIKPEGGATGLLSYGISDADWCERVEQPRLATTPRKY